MGQSQPDTTLEYDLIRAKHELYIAVMMRQKINKCHSLQGWGKCSKFGYEAKDHYIV